MAASALPRRLGPQNSDPDRTHLPENPSSLHCLTLMELSCDAQSEIVKMLDANVAPCPAQVVGVDHQARHPRAAKMAIGNLFMLW